MTSTIQLSVGGSPVPDDLYNSIESLEIEENADRPDVMLLRLPVNRTSSGDLQYVGDGMFEPYTNVSLTVTPTGKAKQCIFDGFVLSWKLHLDRSSGCSTVDIWAQDASWLMNLSDTVKEWPGMTDGQVANAIFGNYGFTPASGNTDGDSPVHDPDGHSLLQRSSDLQFLRGLARRNGKLCRVACTDTRGQRTGYFIAPSTSGSAAVTISLVDPDRWDAEVLEFDWDVMRPSEVDASQIPLDQASDGGTPGNATTSGLGPLDARDYPTYASRPSTLLLTAAADVPELNQRSQAALREANWFARCRGETYIDRLGNTLRVAQVVAIEGAGTLHSGNWFTWSVRHQISIDAVKLQFTLVRNAVGPTPGGGAGGLLGAVAGAL